MRGRAALISCAVVLGVLVLATAGFAASGGEPGRPDQPGKSEASPGSNQDSSNHDPSNPDGTYRGKSSSTPDQDGIGADHGIDNNDKTGAGTDGNNGCGNDADREDDNNGWCGKKPATGVSPTETPTTSPTTGSPSPQAQVLGLKLVKPQVAAQGLAQTGAGLLIPIAMATGLLTMGLGIRAIAKPPRL